MYLENTQSNICFVRRLNYDIQLHEFIDSDWTGSANQCCRKHPPPPPHPLHPQNPLRVDSPWKRASEIRKPASGYQKFAPRCKTSLPASMGAMHPGASFQNPEASFRISEARSGGRFPSTSLMLPYHSPSASRRARELPRKTKKIIIFFHF
jgi:hypothetical protein